MLAHQAGVAADLTSGRTDGAPGPDWTGRQVAERAVRAVEDVAAELRGLEDAMAGLVQRTQEAGRVPAMAWDVVVHHADLHEALGRGRLPEEAWRPVLDGRLALVDDGAALLEGGADPYELFRAVFSRRSRRQVRALLPGLTPEQADALGAFGPRDDEQPTPS